MCYVARVVALVIPFKYKIYGQYAGIYFFLFVDGKWGWGLYAREYGNYNVICNVASGIATVVSWFWLNALPLCSKI